MTDHTPRLSVGLAVFNGAKYLEEAIKSILAQTFTDFELILSDNASTDRTEDICREYAAQDARIRYFRNAENIGGANNENRTFRLSRGEYFRWAAHDDYCAPDLFEKCIAVLDRDSSVILCHSMVNEIDDAGNLIRTRSVKKGESTKPHERFAELALRDHNCEATYGIIRSGVLGKTRLQQNYTDSDRTLLCELSLYGRFHEIPEPLFYKRYHYGNIYLDWRSRMAWFNPALKGRPVFPYWMQFFDYLATIKRIPLSRRTRMHCYAFMGRWLTLFGKGMAKDLFVATYMLLRTGTTQKKEKDKKAYNWE